jgi:hypothetical protein
MSAMSWPSMKTEPELGLLEAGQHAQQRRLAAAGAPEQAEDLALEDLQRDVVDGDESRRSACVTFSTRMYACAFGSIQGSGVLVRVSAMSSS